MDPEGIEPATSAYEAVALPLSYGSVCWGTKPYMTATVYPPNGQFHSIISMYQRQYITTL